jgi:hypothetical protein
MAFWDCVGWKPVRQSYNFFLEAAFFSARPGSLSNPEHFGKTKFPPRPQGRSTTGTRTTSSGSRRSRATRRRLSTRPSGRTVRLHRSLPRPLAQTGRSLPTHSHTTGARCVRATILFFSFCSFHLSASVATQLFFSRPCPHCSTEPLPLHRAMRRMTPT